MNDIAVLGSVMSLYRTADDAKSALYEFILFYKTIDPKALNNKIEKAAKRGQKEKHQFEQVYTTGAVVPATGKDKPPTMVFEQLKTAFESFRSAFRDFHEYSDLEGDKILKGIVNISTVSTSAVSTTKNCMYKCSRFTIGNAPRAGVPWCDCCEICFPCVFTHRPL